MSGRSVQEALLADDLLRAALRNYDKLSEDLRADLPLKRIWSLVEE